MELKVILEFLLGLLTTFVVVFSKPFYVNFV